MLNKMCSVINNCMKIDYNYSDVHQGVGGGDGSDGGDSGDGGGDTCCSRHRQPMRRDLHSLRDQLTSGRT